jgi:hypothetical protein
MEEFHSQPSATSRPSWVVALVVVVAIVGLISLYFANRAGFFHRRQVVKPTNTLKVERTDLSLAQVPDKFPEELVALENGAVVTENYNAKAAGDRFQATRSYETDKALPEIVRTYRNFFNTHDWTIENTLDQEQLKVITATKGSTKVIMSAEENAVTHTHTVSVSARILKVEPQVTTPQ